MRRELAISTDFALARGFADNSLSIPAQARAGTNRPLFADDPDLVALNISAAGG
jgi:hypothetical protein